MRETKIIDQNRKLVWDDRLNEFGSEIDSLSALFEETENILPYYAFVFTNEFGNQGWLTFFDQDDQPYWSEGDKPKLYEIEPQHLEEVKERIRKFNNYTEQRYGKDGYIVPLKECANFEYWQDINTYMHNLMYWESVIFVDQSGPLMQRVAWLAQSVYRLQRDVKENTYSSDVTEKIEKRMEEVAQISDNDFISMDEIRVMMMRYMTHMDIEDKKFKESQKRQIELENQIRDLQAKLLAEQAVSEYRMRFSDTIWKQLKQWFDVPDSNPEVIPANTAR